MHRRYQQFVLPILLSLASACAAPAVLVGSKSVPGARGDVKISKTDNGNSEVVVKVAHLAPPGKVLEGATSYVVWVQNIDHATPPQNVGEIKVSDNLEGTLKTLTSLATFDLTVTPETSPQVVTPANPPVLSTRVERQN